MYLRNKYLITGASSGLGKYLHDNLGGIPFNRLAPNVQKADVIIHCAFNRTRDVTSQNLYQYFSDNILLTQRLTTIPHKKFIYISTVDVYPEDNVKHSEDDVLDVSKVSTLYGITKLIAESLVQAKCSNVLILRCATLLGKDSKENSLIKIINDEHPSLALSADSEFNYILHRSVFEFIQAAVKKDVRGIYNLASSENVSVSRVADLLNKKVNFGNFLYTVGNVDNTKGSAILSAFKKTSEEVISEFLSQ